MEPDIAIKVDRLSKVYPLRNVKAESFKDALLRKAGAVVRRRQKGNIPEFKALTDISFEVKKGQILGVIGKNGAGKTTLLRLLGEITPPSAGKISLAGKVASILEIGIGFHAELSGRENIYLSGSLLGMEKMGISERIDEIINFSGIGKFIELPVKKYSSGMFMRLAFAVVAHVEAEILLLDEVFSVGDAEFVVKSKEKIMDLRRLGKTVVLVSHDLGSIAQFCDLCLVLENGRMAGFGHPGDMIGEYVEEAFLSGKGMDIRLTEEAEAPDEPETGNSESESRESSVPEKDERAEKLKHSVEWSDDAEAPGNEDIRILKVEVKAAGKSVESPIFMSDPFEIRLRYRKMIDKPTNLSFILSKEFTIPVLSATPFRALDTGALVSDDAPGLYEACCYFPGDYFNRGLFSVDLVFVDEENRHVCEVEKLLLFKVHFEKEEDAQFVYSGEFPGPLFPFFNWTSRKLEAD
jgi:lipopolysaccharide transport system ATP-binding protein